jgi:hypothetical protein
VSSHGGCTRSRGEPARHPSSGGSWIGTARGALASRSRRRSLRLPRRRFRPGKLEPAHRLHGAKTWAALAPGLQSWLTNACMLWVGRGPLSELVDDRDSSLIGCPGGNAGSRTAQSRGRLDC